MYQQHAKFHVNMQLSINMQNDYDFNIIMIYVDIKVWRFPRNVQTEVMLSNNRMHCFRISLSSPNSQTRLHLIELSVLNFIGQWVQSSFSE